MTDGRAVSSVAKSDVVVSMGWVGSEIFIVEMGWVGFSYQNVLYEGSSN